MARRLKARYQVSAPKKVLQSYNHCEMVDGDLVQTVATREVILYMVRLPQGHSIRIDKKELERLGFHLKPRLIDMDTGDVVDIGGDPYDFGPDEDVEQEVIIADEDDDMSFEGVGRAATASK